jgi:hypothetical protein
MADITAEEDPFTTSLPANANATEIEAHRKALEEAKKKELAECQKFHLEQQTAEGPSHYHH